MGGVSAYIGMHDINDEALDRTLKSDMLICAGATGIRLKRRIGIADSMRAALPCSCCALSR